MKSFTIFKFVTKRHRGNSRKFEFKCSNTK
uniref:Uncharacterized protein n=1 Tax=Rhizophora mucronata TaxID=61149 RepID=A0A2P2M468_RHIMU